MSRLAWVMWLSYKYCHFTRVGFLLLVVCSQSAGKVSILCSAVPLTFWTLASKVLMQKHLQLQCVTVSQASTHTQLFPLLKRLFSTRVTRWKGNGFVVIITLHIQVFFIRVLSDAQWSLQYFCLLHTVGCTDSLTHTRNPIQTSPRYICQWGWRVMCMACTWMKCAAVTPTCILLAPPGSTLCGVCASPIWKCVCSTGENMQKPQWLIICSVETNIQFGCNCLKMPSVLVCACADLPFVSAAQRLTIICSRPLLNRKGGCGFRQRRSTGDMWATLFYFPYTRSHAASAM